MGLWTTEELQFLNKFAEEVDDLTTLEEITASATSLSTNKKLGVLSLAEDLSIQFYTKLCLLLVYLLAKDSFRILVVESDKGDGLRIPKRTKVSFFIKHGPPLPYLTTEIFHLEVNHSLARSTVRTMLRNLDKELFHLFHDTVANCKIEIAV